MQMIFIVGSQESEDLVHVDKQVFWPEKLYDFAKVVAR